MWDDGTDIDLEARPEPEPGTHHDVEALLDLLPARERRAVELRFRLDGQGERSREKVGAAIGGVSGERARQVIEAALGRLWKQGRGEGRPDEGDSRGPPPRSSRWPR